MKETRLVMGMPVRVEIAGDDASALEYAFDYFSAIDERFSTYKPGSEISKLNRRELSRGECSAEMREVLARAEETKRATRGYFDIETPEGALDPSGLVKGWAIRNAANLLRCRGHCDFWVEAGGDIQVSGTNPEGREWSLGIRNPFDAREIVKVVHPRGCGVATSGTYIRGRHLYDPHSGAPVSSDIVSLTVIGPDVYEADRFATAAFAMGREGMPFLEAAPGLEAYAIRSSGIAEMTSGFEKFVEEHERASVRAKAKAVF